jgi:hypothetical protein
MESANMPSVSPATMEVSRFAGSEAFRFFRGAREALFVVTDVSPVFRFAPMRVPSRRPARGRSE